MVAGFYSSYGYYTFLRIVVCISAALFAYLAWDRRRIEQA
jgi:hypothetical protein